MSKFIRKVRQPVTKLVEGKTLTITATPALNTVKFENQHRGFLLDIERTRDLHSKLGSLLAEIDAALSKTEGKG